MATFSASKSSFRVSKEVMCIPLIIDIMTTVVYLNKMEGGGIMDNSILHTKETDHDCNCRQTSCRACCIRASISPLIRQWLMDEYKGGKKPMLSIEHFDFIAEKM